MREEGNANFTDKLAADLLKLGSVTDLGNFHFQIPTGHGNERWQIIGLDSLAWVQWLLINTDKADGPSALTPLTVLRLSSAGLKEIDGSDAARRAGCQGRPQAQWDATQHLALATPVDRGFDMKNWHTVSLGEVMAHKLWVLC